MNEEVPADWGDSSGGAGARLAAAKEENSYKRFEREFQIKVLYIISALCIFLIVIDKWSGSSSAKDLISMVVPLFTFVLGRLESKAPG